MQAVDLERFYIGRTEVTNAAFQEFVDAGGYARSELWKHPFVKEGRTLSFDEAMSHFVDSTGRPGPSTWILGEYPQGQADYPVEGVSWFEAAAYAEFRGQSLPTVYHWAAAALPASEMIEPLSNALLPLSNLEGNGPEPVASRPAISFAGAYDMAGNVRRVDLERGGREALPAGRSVDGPRLQVHECFPRVAVGAASHLRDPPGGLPGGRACRAARRRDRASRRGFLRHRAPLRGCLADPCGTSPPTTPRR